MSSEALWLFKQLNLHLDLEGRFQPREKGLSLIEGAAEVGEGGGGWLLRAERKFQKFQRKFSLMEFKVR